MANLIYLNAQKWKSIHGSRAAHAKWADQVATSTALHKELVKTEAEKPATRAGVVAKDASVTLQKTELQHSIEAQVPLHDKWQKYVRQVVAWSAKIQAEEKRRADWGVSTVSLSLAKAAAIWEGGRSADGLFRPYQDSVGVWTIGYGHTNADGGIVVGPSTPPLTSDEAVTLLLHDLNVIYTPAVAKYLKLYQWKLNQKAFDALVDFAYNLGPGYFARGNSVGDDMFAHDGHALADDMLRFNHAGGQVLAGLTRRRQWERQLFLNGSYAITN